MTDGTVRLGPFIAQDVLITRWRLYMFRFLAFAGWVFAIQSVSEATSKRLAVVLAVAFVLLVLSVWTDWCRANDERQTTNGKRQTTNP